MLTKTNRLDVPEITAYSRQDVEGGHVVRYLQRQPGQTCWEPVTIFRPDPEALVPCRQCGEPVPPRSLSDGVCVPCLWPTGD